MKNRQLSLRWIAIGMFTVLLILAACTRTVPTDVTPAPTVSVADAQSTATPDIVVVTPEGVAPEGETPAEGEIPAEGTDGTETVEGSDDPNAGGGTPAEGTAPTGNTPTPPATDGNTGGTGSTTLPTTHVVQAGETVYSISVRYGVSIDAIAVANNLNSYYTIYVGQTLVIPADDGTVPPPVATVPPPGGCSTTHIVQPGENLFRIGLTYGYTVDELAAANPEIVNPNNIKVGQPICIP